MGEEAHGAGDGLPPKKKISGGKVVNSGERTSRA